MPTPLTDFWDFLIGNTDDYNALGAWKYLLVVLFLALIVASIGIALKNWREDPYQRSAAHLATWFIRVLVGGMWFQGIFWKLRLPVAGGLKYWLEQMANRRTFLLRDYSEEKSARYRLARLSTSRSTATTRFHLLAEITSSVQLV